MKILIIEDEKAAAKRLISLIRQLDAKAEVLDVLDTVKLSVRWFHENPGPDLVFMDIQLADGLSFDIFEQYTLSIPVIFTTAYDQYAIKAFKVNSIDYLLKPIVPEELESALKKFKDHYHQQSGQIDFRQIQQTMKALTKAYKSRFIVKVGEHIKAVEVGDIHYFCSREKMTYMFAHDGRHYIVDYSLDHLENSLDPKVFFRISRKYIVSVQAIADIITYSSSRLRLILRQSDDKDILVSRERVAGFKAWLDQ
ncbi:two-component system LytT family response regulator [Catalinimonas alkaloidigena]|uniref:LytR/AlgR family response regulator transcription factor n=1 Tax=Catalinimonas alkaloidigena TaxID=1075417 RepID=UPI0024074D55|nr:LytTR family DNA-binding domain-containing protein [Catalinimonas alkaloidigena]MDF9798768.1 two-component system LytT family response regulator [Catalinimonas alkaloidigena]